MMEFSYIWGDTSFEHAIWMIQPRICLIILGIVTLKNQYKNSTKIALFLTLKQITANYECGDEGNE